MAGSASGSGETSRGGAGGRSGSPDGAATWRRRSVGLWLGRVHVADLRQLDLDTAVQIRRWRNLAGSGGMKADDELQQDWLDAA